MFVIGNSKAILKHTQIQKEKLNNLRVTRLENCSQDPDKFIYNFSDYKLTESEKRVLCKVFKFAFSLNKLQCADFVTVSAIVS